MLRSTTEQGPTGLRRLIQIVCDECLFATASVEHGSAGTERSIVLEELRKHTGFVEVGWREWSGVIAPQGIGENAIRDLCARCAEKKKGSV